MKTQEKLELKHLAPYLPYRLKFLIPNDEHCKVQIMTGLSEDDGIQTDYEEEDEHGCIGNLWAFEGEKNYKHYGVKPLLHPLSRLAEPILEDGKTPEQWFIQISDLDYIDDHSTWVISDLFWNFKIQDEDSLKLLPHGLIEKLFEWHFDVFGLIDKGLAEPIELTDKD